MTSFFVTAGIDAPFAFCYALFLFRKNQSLMNYASDDSGLGKVAIEFAVQSRSLMTVPDLTAALQAVILPLEITAAASGYISGPRAASLEPFHFTTWSQAWVKIYLENEFVLADPLPRWARASGRALTWSELFANLPPRDDGLKVFDAAFAFGFAEGLLIPMRAEDNSLGLVAFGTPRASLRVAEQAFLTVVGRAAFEAAERIERGGNGGRIAPAMTEREIGCLALLVQGHADREIACILGITPSTVRFHLGNAREKTGAVSRTHMAALAVQFGYGSL
jgi:DNA-binding CsgD family transcriptional regulator